MSMKNFLIIAFIFISHLSNAQESNRNMDFAMSVNSKTGETAMTKEELIQATLGVHVNKNSEFAGRTMLIGFTFKCPGQKAFVIQGNQLTGQAIQCIKQAKVGDYISLYDPKFSIDGSVVKTSGNKSVVVELK
jgi:hypothetical protein